VKLDELSATERAFVGAVTCVNRGALVGERNFMPAPGLHIEGVLIKTVDRFCNNRRKQQGKAVWRRGF
jgi:hypothetical protein